MGALIKTAPSMHTRTGTAPSVSFPDNIHDLQDFWANRSFAVSAALIAIGQPA